MTQALLIVQIILSIIITVSVLLQAQGAGLGATWGGGGETYHTKRGLEKILVYVTVASILLFAIAAIAALLL